MRITSASTSISNNGPGLVVSIQATVNPAPPSVVGPGSEGTVTFSDSEGVLCGAVPLTGNTADCTTTAVTPGGGQIAVAYSGSTDFAPSNTTTDAATVPGAPVIVSVTVVNDPAWLVTGGGFSGTTSVTVCAVAVPFTVLNGENLLVAMPPISGPQQCTMVVVAAGGTATANVEIPVVPVPGAPVNVSPGGSSSGTPPPSCNVQTLTLTGQWTLIAWPGTGMPPARPLPPLPMAARPTSPPTSR